MVEDKIAQIEHWIAKNESKIKAKRAWLIYLQKEFDQDIMWHNNMHNNLEIQQTLLQINEYTVEIETLKTVLDLLRGGK